MKKVILFLCLLIGTCVCGNAQETGIRFEQGLNWNKLVKKAKKEKRLLFVDCYTSWCGPCATMAHTVFTRDTVGNYFNSHFLNVKYDVENEADGKMLRNKFRVEVYPTMLFIDPETGEEEHRIVGARNVRGLILAASVAMDSRNSNAGLARRYVAGEREPEFLKQYYSALVAAALPGDDRVALEYLDAVYAEELATAEHWTMIVRYVNDPLLFIFRNVMTNRERFYGIADRYAVDFFLETTIHTAVSELVGWRPGKDEFNEERNNELIKYLRTIDSPVAPGALANLYAAACIRNNDFIGLLENLKEASKYNVFREGEDKKYFADNIEIFATCGDKALIRDVITLIDDKCTITESFYGKADLMKLKVRLQEQVGDVVGMEKSKMLEKKYREAGDGAGEWMN